MARTSESVSPAVTTARRAASPSDADALLRDLYAEHEPALLRLTTPLTGGDRGRAEDLVQEPCCGRGTTATIPTSSTAHPGPG
jgi:hypothetical protein